MKFFIASVIASALVIGAFLVGVVAHIAIGALVVWIFNYIMGANFGTVAVGVVALVSWLRSRGDLPSGLAE